MELMIQRAGSAPELNGDWDAPVWQKAETAEINHFHARSSEHRPHVRARLLYDASSLYGIFRVDDRYVRSVHTEYQSGVCQDSCVEFFFTPCPESDRYINFEWNCGGAMLLNVGTNESVPDRQVLGEEARQQVEIFHSLPTVVEPEIADPTTWILQFRIEMALLAAHFGELGELSGRCWRGNLYKCGDQTSHPHWASWAPIGEKLSFHNPAVFGTLRFA